MVVLSYQYQSNSSLSHLYFNYYKKIGMDDNTFHVSRGLHQYGYNGHGQSHTMCTLVG